MNRYDAEWCKCGYRRRDHPFHSLCPRFVNGVMIRSRDRMLSPKEFERSRFFNTASHSDGSSRHPAVNASTLQRYEILLRQQPS